MDTLPFLLGSESSGEPIIPIDPAKSSYQETWLQELLRLHPEILPVAEIESVFHPLIPIGREVPVTAGYIDNLFISERGYPVIVETKLWRNPEAKREVLAQLIDYASSISDWTFEKLDQVSRTYTKQYEGRELGLIEWVETKHSPDVDRHFFEETVSRNLRLGRILLLVVGDRIRSSVIEMLSYINKYPHLAINVALIELRFYKLTKGGDWPILVVPSILAKTEILERSIVQVNVTLEGVVKVDATQEKFIETPTTVRSSMSEDDFWERLKNQNPEALEPARKLVSYYREKAIVIKPRENSIAFHLYLPETDQRVSLFFVRTDGIVECWPPTISGQLTKVGLDKNLMDVFVRELQEILKHSTKKLAVNYPLNKVDVDAFITVFDRFIDGLIKAEPKE